jgi:hypothetical protein
MDPITNAFIAAMEQFARQEGAPTVTFEKGQRKDDVPARISRSSWAKKVCCSVARRKKGTPVFRTERQRNEQTEPSVHELVRTTAMGNHSYVYGLDRGFWALLSEVLHLPPLQRQALFERPRLCQTTTGQARHQL